MNKTPIDWNDSVADFIKIKLAQPRILEQLIEKEENRMLAHRKNAYVQTIIYKHQKMQFEKSQLQEKPMKFKILLEKALKKKQLIQADIELTKIQVEKYYAQSKMKEPIDFNVDSPSGPFVKQEVKNSQKIQSSKEKIQKLLVFQQSILKLQDQIKELKNRNTSLYLQRDSIRKSLQNLEKKKDTQKLEIRLRKAQLQNKRLMNQKQKRQSRVKTVQQNYIKARASKLIKTAQNSKSYLQSQLLKEFKQSAKVINKLRQKYEIHEYSQAIVNLSLGDAVDHMNTKLKKNFFNEEQLASCQLSLNFKQKIDKQFRTKDIYAQLSHLEQLYTNLSQKFTHIIKESNELDEVLHYMNENLQRKKKQIENQTIKIKSLKSI